MKICPRCKKSFEDIMFLTKSGRKKPYCPECTREYDRARFPKEKARRKVYAQKYEEEHKTEILQYRKEHYKRNRDYVIARQKKYREEHLEECRASDLRYSASHREERRQKSIEYYYRTYTKEKGKRRAKKLKEHMSEDPEYAKRVKDIRKRASHKFNMGHREGHRLYVNAWNHKNPEKAKEIRRRSVRKWRATHPEKSYAYTARRNALRRGAKLISFDEVAHIRNQFKRQNGRCLYCGDLLTLLPKHKNSKTLDHFYPINRGGMHSADNLVLSCQPCNSSKHDHIYGTEWTCRLDLKK